MDGASDELLAGAGLPFDQNSRLGWSNHLDLV